MLTYIQMTCEKDLITTPHWIQNVNVLAETLVKLVHKFCGNLEKFLGRSMAFQRSKLVDAFFWTGFLAGKQMVMTEKASTLTISEEPLMQLSVMVRSRHLGRTT